MKKKTVMTNSVPGVTTISLFSGCGGSDVALQEAGYDIVWANDIWKFAGEIYEANITNSRMALGSIDTFDTFKEAEFLVGCYPCTSYSQAGSRDWDSDTNYLYREFDRVLRRVRPRAFVVENVNGMAFGQNYDTMQKQLRRYRLAGYRVKWQVLNAKDFGVAQHRRRIFLVGIRSDVDFEYSFPKPTHGPGLVPYVSQRDAIGGMPSWPEGEFNDEPFHWYYLSRKRRVPWGQPSPCIVGNWRHVPLHPLSPPLRRVDTDSWVFTREARARRLSYKECAALQGFKKTFTFESGKVRDRFKVIGNAVPPPLFSAVIKPLEAIWS